MFPVPEQFSAATKAQFEAQFEAQLKIINALTIQAFDSAEKVIALNINATKAVLEKSSAATKQLFAAQDAGNFLPLGAVPAPPDLVSMMAYGRELLGIAAPATLAAAVPKPDASVVAKPVEAAKPAAAVVAKPVVAAAKPDVAVAKPVAATKPVAVTKPAKPAAAIKAVTKPAPVIKPVAVDKRVAVAKPVAPIKPVAAATAAAAPVAAAKKGVAPFPKSPVGK